jgi:hypothetical protein
MNPANITNQDSSQDWTFKTEEEIEEERVRLAATSTSTDFLVFREADPVKLIVNLTPDLTMTFHNEGKVVGSMSWATGKFVFSGEADESANALLEAMKFYIEGYIQRRVLEAQLQMVEYMEKFK